MFNTFLRRLQNGIENVKKHERGDTPSPTPEDAAAGSGWSTAGAKKTQGDDAFLSPKRMRKEDTTSREDAGFSPDFKLSDTQRKASNRAQRVTKFTAEEPAAAANMKPMRGHKSVSFADLGSPQTPPRARSPRQATTPSLNALPRTHQHTATAWDAPIAQQRNTSRSRGRSQSRAAYAEIQRQFHKRLSRKRPETEATQLDNDAEDEGMAPLVRESTLVLNTSGTYVFDGADAAIVEPHQESDAAATTVEEQEKLEHRAKYLQDIAASESAAALEEDKALMKEFEAMLDEAAAMQVEKFVDRRVGWTWAGVGCVIWDTVVDMVAPRARRAKGVQACIAGGKPVQIPVDLDTADEQRLEKLATNGTSNDIVMNGSGFSIRRYQLRSCEGTEWLNDQVINYYCKLVESQYEKNVVTLGTHFFSKLNGGDRDGAHRWTRRVDVFSPRVVLIVINLGKHWTLAVLNNEMERLEYYDSLGGTGHKMLDSIASFLDAEWEKKRGVKAIPNGSFMKWTRLTPGKDAPQQNNNVDCGVFTSQYALCVAQGVPFNFTQKDIPYLRKQMMLEVLNQKLLVRM